jgi:hypothetical protein
MNVKSIDKRMLDKRLLVNCEKMSKERHSLVPENKTTLTRVWSGCKIRIEFCTLNSRRREKAVEM